MNNIKIKPYLCIPYLVEQPTWGGEYIAQYKSWQNKPNLQGKKIGQSYELYGKTKLSLTIKHSGQEDFYFDDTNFIYNQDVLNLSDLIALSPINVLGSKVFLKHGKMPILLKFTQALGNSFQIHTQNPNDRWDTKPEAWYYLEPGLITFGVREEVNWQKYKSVCHDIDRFMNQISKQVRNEFIHLDEAHRKARKFINEEHPIDFVNLHLVGKGEIIDLSDGGIHHSWEQNQEELPLGNIVYEIQLDKRDDDTTIRSFDQGKIKDNGNIREIHIDDYFNHINKDSRANLLEVAQDQPIELVSNSKGIVRRILFNEHYGMEEIEIVTSMYNEYTTTTDSFHHLFVRDGEIDIVCDYETLTITKGHSAFIPASTGKYEIKNKVETPAVVIKSYC